MSKACIFIDEFGNTHLDLSKVKTPSHFIYTSVVMSESSIQKAEAIRKKICLDFRLGPDIKSSNIGEKDFRKRLRMLERILTDLDFTVDTLVVDKSKLDSPGFQFKKVFYKYFQSLFITKYHRRFEQYEIWADKVGEEFRHELQAYVAKTVPTDLFNQDRSFKIADDIKEQKLLQFADFISGCVGKIFCANHAHTNARAIYEIIHTRLAVDFFPFESSRKPFLSREDDGADDGIRKLNSEILEKYLSENDTPLNNEKNRLLNYLSLQSTINPERLVPTSELLSYLQNFIPTTTQDRIRTIIRDLRYEGLFIVSHTGKSGYKLATSYADISEHFNHFMKYIIPMLQKIQVLNQTLSQNTFNKINPIEKDDNFKTAKELLAAIG